MLDEVYPDKKSLEIGHYKFDDILDQIIFELIKEDYREHASKATIQDYIYQYDIDAPNRKYTRAIQYAQHYKDFDNENIEQAIGIRIPEMEAQDVSGSKVFQGHQYTLQEYWGLKMVAECKLFEKIHGHQIDSSKKVSESKFRDLFNEYESLRDEIEPPVKDLEQVVANTLFYFGTEEHFSIELMYEITFQAEKRNFPAIPTNRILDFIQMYTILPRKKWCKDYFFAMNTMLMKRDLYSIDIFDDSDEEWNLKREVILDTYRLKNAILQSSSVNKLFDLVHQCTLKEKADFIIEYYWIWDNQHEFEWNSARIQYYRKLNKELNRAFPKPHIK